MFCGSLVPPLLHPLLTASRLLSARRILGPANETVLNPICDRPLGGPLLKWDWATSSFRHVPGISGAGYRIAIMPETHMPWIVDGCGQLSGWTPSLKRLYAPVPKLLDKEFYYQRAEKPPFGYFDIAAVNNTGELLADGCGMFMMSLRSMKTKHALLLAGWLHNAVLCCAAVFSGCSSYNPVTRSGDIAASAGCTLSAAVGPKKQLYTSAVGSLAVTTNGQELVANGKSLLFFDAAMGR